MLRSRELSQPGRVPPIKRLGVLGDCDTSAIITETGDITWMGLPEEPGKPGTAGPSVFSSLLGGKGHFSVAPAEAAIVTGRRYIDDSRVLKTDWVTASGGRLRVKDTLSWTPKGGADDVLVRVVTCTRGEVAVDVRCLPVFDYDQTPADWQWDADRGYYADWRGLTLRLRTDMPVVFGAEEPDLPVELRRAQLSGRFTLKEGQSCYIALAWGGKKLPRNLWAARALVKRTVRGWQDWVATGNFQGQPWRSWLVDSALTLKLMCCSSGAIAAALTTSLPETEGGIRNWDYRATWIRDGSLAAEALHALGFREEAERFVQFVLNLPGVEKRLQIMYGLDGSTELPEKVLAHLPGYGGAKPVHDGNDAYDQDQNDVWGQFLNLVWILYKDRPGRLPDKLYKLVVSLAGQARAALRKPDSGIWEVRGKLRHFTSSRHYLWVAFDRAAQLARKQGDSERARRWAIRARGIKRGMKTAVNDRGVFTMCPGSEALDASNLLISILGMLPPDHEYVVNTVWAIAKNLTQDGMVLRYRPDQVDEGLGTSDDEGTFVICSFWQVIAFARIGEPDEAMRLLHKLLAHAGPLGYYAEEIDARTGEFLGNFPQAFSHIGLIMAILAIADMTTAGTTTRAAAKAT